MITNSPNAKVHKIFEYFRLEPQFSYGFQDEQDFLTTNH